MTNRGDRHLLEVSVLGPLRLVFQERGERVVAVPTADDNPQVRLQRKHIVALATLIAREDTGASPTDLAHAYFRDDDQHRDFDTKSSRAKSDYFRSELSVMFGRKSKQWLLRPMTYEFNTMSNRWVVRPSAIEALGIMCDAHRLLAEGPALTQSNDLEAIDALIALWRADPMLEHGLGTDFFREHRQVLTDLQFRKAQLLGAQTGSEEEHSAGMRAVSRWFEDNAPSDPRAADVRQWRLTLERSPRLAPLTVEQVRLSERAPTAEPLEQKHIGGAVGREVIGQLLEDESVEQGFRLAALYLGLSRHLDGYWAVPSTDGSHGLDGTAPAQQQSVTSWCALSLYDAVGESVLPILDPTRAFFRQCEGGRGVFGLPHQGRVQDVFGTSSGAFLPHFRYTASAVKFFFVLDGPSRQVADGVRFLVEQQLARGPWAETFLPHQLGNVLSTTHVLDTLEKVRDSLPQLDELLGADPPLSLQVPHAIEDGLHWLASVQDRWQEPAGVHQTGDVDHAAQIVCFLPQLFRRYRHCFARLNDTLMAMLEPPLRLDDISHWQVSALGRKAMAAFGLSRIEPDVYRDVIDDAMRDCIHTVHALAQDRRRPSVLDAAFVLLLTQLSTADQRRLDWGRSVGRQLQLLVGTSPQRWDDHIDQVTRDVLLAWLAQ